MFMVGCGLFVTTAWAGFVYGVTVCDENFEYLMLCEGQGSEYRDLVESLPQHKYFRPRQLEVSERNIYHNNSPFELLQKAEGLVVSVTDAVTTLSSGIVDIIFDHRKRSIASQFHAELCIMVDAPIVRRSLNNVERMTRGRRLTCLTMLESLKYEEGDRVRLADYGG